MRPAGSFEVPAACPPVNGGTEMKESTLAASSRLGGAVISDRVVASLLDELRTGAMPMQTACLRRWILPPNWG